MARLTDTRTTVSLLSNRAFRHSLVATVDHQAVAIADLSSQIHAVRQFMADLSARLDELTQAVQGLHAAQAWDAAEPTMSRRYEDSALREARRRQDEKES